MKRTACSLAVLMAACLPTLAAEKGENEQAIAETLSAYLEAFNNQDAEAVGMYWAEDGVSVDQATGEQTVGRAAIVQELKSLFEDSPGTKLTGEILSVRMIRPEVATVEGRATLFIGSADPIESLFTAIFVKEGDAWKISSSNERDLPSPTSSYDALKELEWLVGSWQDQSDTAAVNTSVRWSPNQAFLIRSFYADFPDGRTYQGTQVIGWDPISKQIRTWTFHSDGSFGQGTISRSEDAWQIKMWQVLGDGTLANATRRLTRLDDNSFTLQTISQSMQGEPTPSSPAITVVRIEDETVAGSGEGATE